VTARTVVVTGGGKGIGRAVTLAFAAAGERVLAIGRDRAALEETAAEGGAAVQVKTCDVTDEAAVAGLFEEAGVVDVLVNNAGISSSAPLARATLADWRDQFEVNATAAFLCTRAALPGMSQRDSGRIVTVASTAGLMGYRYTAGYTASKHAAVGLMRAVAAEIAGSGVTANAVCPAFVDTEMTRRSVARIAEATGRSEQEAIAALAATSPLGRLLDPAEVAAAVRYLASAEAGALNGQTIVLDGGGIQA
jgi:NAD(P)-dependent dehydrogenase (short-subunit alcohol dehydrogenase family)